MRFPLLVIMCALGAFLIPFGVGEFAPVFASRLCGPPDDCAALPPGEYLLQVLGTLSALALPILLVVGGVRSELQVRTARKLGVQVEGSHYRFINTDDFRCPPELARAYRINTFVTFGGFVLCLVLVQAAVAHRKEREAHPSQPAPEAGIHCIMDADGGCRVAAGKVSARASGRTAR